MTCRRAIVTALLAGFATILGAGSAHARMGAALLDADAPVVVRADPAELFALADNLADVGGPAGGAVALLRVAFKLHAGHDLLTRAGFSRLGFDLKRPLWIQLGAIEGQRATEIYAHLGSARDWTPQVLRKADKIMWRSRIVFPIRNQRKAVKALTALASAVTTMHRVRSKEREALAALLGARPQRGAQIESTLRSAGIDAIGWLDGLDSFVLVRHGRRYATLELVSSFAGVPVVWVRDRRKILRALPKLDSKGGGFAELMAGGGAAGQLAEPGVHLWLGSKALRTTLVAIAQTNALRALATTLPQPAAQAKRFSAKTSATCSALDEIADKGAITDVALVSRWTGGALHLGLSWGFRDEPVWLSSMISGQPGPVAVGDKQLTAAATLLLRRPAALAGLWRPALLDKGLTSGLRELLRCPAGSLSALALTAWPELGGAFIADLRNLHPVAKALVDQLGPSAIAIQRAALTAEEASAAIEMEVGKSASDVADMFAQLFGPARAQDQMTLWGQGPLLAFQRARGAGTAGFATGQKALDWYAALPPGKIPAKPGLIAFGRVRVDRLLEQLGSGHPQIATLASWAQKRAHEGAIEVAVRAKLLTATATLEGPP